MSVMPGPAATPPLTSLSVKGTFKGMGPEDHAILRWIAIIWLFGSAVVIFCFGSTIGLCVSVLLLWAGLNGLVRVSTITYGVVTRFSRRTGRVLTEGWHFIWPLNIERVEIIPYDLKNSVIDVIVFAKDGVGIAIKGNVQWQPAGINLEDENGRPLLFKYMETLDDKIDTGLTDTVKDGVGTVAGLYNPDTFIRSREAIYLIINSYLRLEVPPHLDGGNNALFPNGYKKVTDGGRLKFYKDSSTVIGEMLKQENKEESKISDVEKRYGIDIITFALASIDFSDEVKAAMNAKREAEGRLEAAKVRVKQKVDSMKQLTEEGKLTSEQAHDTSDAVLGTATPRQVLDIRGGGNSIPIINFNPPTQKGGK